MKRVLLLTILATSLCAIAKGNKKIKSHSGNARLLRMEDPGSDFMVRDTSPHTLQLEADGDVIMPAYDDSRDPASDPTNFAGWDEDGKLEKYSVDDLYDYDWVKKGTSQAPSNSDTASRSGVTQLDGSPLLWTRSSPGYFGVVKPIQLSQRSSDWLFSINSTPNAGSDRENFTLGMGFNINTGGGPAYPGLSGIGLSFEDHYEPTPGDSIAEYHTFFIDGEGTQHRLESYTIRKAVPSSWEKFHTLAKQYWKDPTNGNTWLQFNRGNDSSSGFYMFGSSSQTGTLLFSDAAANNFQIIPHGLTEGSRYLYMSQWDYVDLPGMLSAKIGGNQYNYARKHLIAATDNDCKLGTPSNRFSIMESCALKITNPSDNTDLYFEVSDMGGITFAQYDEAFNSPGDPVNILNTDASGNLRSDPLSSLSNTHTHDETSITPDLISGINGVRNDGGEISIQNAWGLNLNADDNTNSITIEVDSAFVATKNDLASGFYNPVVSNALNTNGTPSPTEAQYIRVLNVVTVSGRVTIDPAADSQTVTFDLSLPVPSTISSSAFISGTAHSGTTWFSTVEISGNTGTNSARFRYTPKNDIDLNAHVFSYSFTYRIN